MEITYTIPGRDEAIDALFFDDNEEPMEEFEQRRASALADTYLAAQSYGCIQIEAGGLTWYLHSSARTEGLQLTSWDERGPMGHYDVNDGGDLSQYIDYQRGPVTVTAA